MKSSKALRRRRERPSVDRALGEAIDRIIAANDPFLVRGEPVPSHKEFAREFRISPGSAETVRRELIEKDLFVTRNKTLIVCPLNAPSESIFFRINTITPAALCDGVSALWAAIITAASALPKDRLPDMSEARSHVASMRNAASSDRLTIMEGYLSHYLFALKQPLLEFIMKQAMKYWKARHEHAISHFGNWARDATSQARILEIVDEIEEFVRQGCLRPTVGTNYRFAYLLRNLFLVSMAEGEENVGSYGEVWRGHPSHTAAGEWLANKVGLMIARAEPFIPEYRRYCPGNPAPSIRDVMKHERVGKDTARSANDLLVHSGLLFGKQGRLHVGPQALIAESDVVDGFDPSAHDIVLLFRFAQWLAVEILADLSEAGSERWLEGRKERGPERRHAAIFYAGAVVQGMYYCTLVIDKSPASLRRHANAMFDLTLRFIGMIGFCAGRPMLVEALVHVLALLRRAFDAGERLGSEKNLQMMYQGCAIAAAVLATDRDVFGKRVPKPPFEVFDQIAIEIGRRDRDDIVT